MTFTKNIPNIFQGPPNPEYKTEIFSKRTHKISKILFNLGSCEYLARLESRISKCLFFDGSLIIMKSFSR